MEYMPIQETHFAIRMSVLDGEQAKRNHAQTLRRLAERGGVSPCEAVALAEGRRWKPMEEEKALEALVEK
jgi:hypothetical protein